MSSLGHLLLPQRLLRHRCSFLATITCSRLPRWNKNKNSSHVELLVRYRYHSSTITPQETSSTHHAFDRPHKRKQRDNAARAVKAWRARKEPTTTTTTPSTAATATQEVVEYDYIRDEIAARLVDRLDDMKRAFPLALDWGAGSGHIHRAICADDSLVAAVAAAEDDNGNSGEPSGGIGGVRKLVQLDAAHNMLHRDKDIPVEGGHRCDTYRLEVEDEEARLPFPDGTFDLVVSSCALHWVNQLPKVFAEIHRILKPDGCFLLAMMGGTETLPELRASMVLAELEREGGVSPHVGPFAQVSDVGSLMQRAGFALPTVDVDTHKVTYPNAVVLMQHLQRMGENNASLQRRDRVSRQTFLATACIYDELFPVEEGRFGEIEASMQVIYAIGWTPHVSQQKPLERGTATHKVGEIVEPTVEVTRASKDNEPPSK